MEVIVRSVRSVVCHQCDDNSRRQYEVELPTAGHVVDVAYEIRKGFSAVMVRYGNAARPLCLR